MARPHGPRVSILQSLFLWGAIGIVTVSGVVLREIGVLLADISDQTQAYSPSVFSAPRLPSSTEIRDAFSLWENTARAGGWVNAHLLVDTVLFAPALYYLLYRALRRINKTRGPAFLACGALVSDWAENAVVAFYHGRGESFIAAAILSDLKWGILFFSAVFGLISWMSQRKQPLRPPVHPGVHLRWLGVLVAAFLALVAFPGGGPLDQVPDIVLAQLYSGIGLLGPITALLLFAGSTAFAGRRAVGGKNNDNGALGYWAMIGLAAGFGFLLLGLSLLFHSSVTFVPFAALFVVLSVSIIARGYCKFAGSTNGHGNTESSGTRIDQRKPDNTSFAHLSTKQQRTTTPTESSIDTWIAGLAAAIVLGGLLGLARSATKPFLIVFHNNVIIVLGVALFSVVAGVVAGLIQIRMARVLRLKVMIIFPIITALATAALAWRPELAIWVGTNGAFAVGLAAASLAFGELVRLGRTTPRWRAMSDLATSWRTPWAGLLVTSWLCAGLIAVDPGYHLVRAAPNTIAAPMYPSLDDAFTTWQRTINEIPACKQMNPIPLVLVAAPGGGIRATYWTALGLDHLSSGPCGSAAIFAISSVSGGSLGATIWAASGGKNSSVTASELASDRALAGSTAAFTLRDPLAALIGVGHLAWRDRAAVMEDLWTSSAPALGSPKQPRAWTSLRTGTWTPAMALNGTSVTDGCRILISNVAKLSTGQPDCQAGPGVNSTQPNPFTTTRSIPEAGPVTGAIDALTGFLGPVSNGDRCSIQSPKPDMPAATAALLSARFPIVSPSGGITRCVTVTMHQDNKETEITEARAIYSVDGGYAENSGLRTLLDIYRRLEAKIARSPLSIAVHIVVLDNHYANNSIPRTSGRPRELWTPLETVSRTKTTQGELEQIAQRDLSLTPQGMGPHGSAARQANLSIVAPRVHPSVTAPLGWVLSRFAQKDLQDQIEQRWGCPHSMTANDSADTSPPPIVAALDLSPKIICSARH